MCRVTSSENARVQEDETLRKYDFPLNISNQKKNDIRWPPMLPKGKSWEGYPVMHPHLQEKAAAARTLIE